MILRDFRTPIAKCDRVDGSLGPSVIYKPRKTKFCVSTENYHQISNIQSNSNPKSIEIAEIQNFQIFDIFFNIHTRNTKYTGFH